MWQSPCRIWHPLLRATAVTLGASVTEPQALPEHGVTVVFVALPNTKVELLEPLGDAIRRSRRSSPRTRPVACITFATRSTDIIAARDTLKASGARVLGDGEPKIGAHGKPVLFLHPKDFQGTLIELEQV
ncbi:VOC family protein [Ensifer canadensis]